jgi:hypothetical protein
MPAAELPRQPNTALATSSDELALLPRSSPRFKQHPPWFARVARNIHIDCIVPDWAKLGEDFDPERFADKIHNANATSAVVYGKCHHGYAYYPSKVGVTHPQMGVDVLGQMVNAIKKRGIFCFAYYSALRDSYQNERHPDWRKVNAKGKQSRGFYSDVCFNSPYGEKIFLPQLEEIVRKYPVDGLWIDIMAYYDGCFCRYCQTRFKEAGVDIHNTRQRRAFVATFTREWARKAYERVKKIRPEVLLHFNHLTKMGMRKSLEFEDLSNVENAVPLLEYAYFPAYARHVRTLGQPFGGVTSRFEILYGHFGTVKSPEMLKWQCATNLASGAASTVIDFAPNTLRLETPVYQTLGKVFGFVKEREPWCLNSVSVPEIAVLTPRHAGYFGFTNPHPGVYGAVTALTELQQHFDVIDENEDFECYRLILLPDAFCPFSMGKKAGIDIQAAADRPSDAALRRLAQYVAKGGRLLTVNLELPDSVPELNDVFGIESLRDAPMRTGYVRPATQEMWRDLPRMDLNVAAQFQIIDPKPGAELLARSVMPIGDGAKRYTHAPAPPQKEPFAPAIIANRYGKGQSAYIAVPLLSAFYETPTLAPRTILRNTLDHLLPPAKRLLEVDGPRSLEVHFMAQPGRRILHLINFHAERQRSDKRYIIEDIPQVHNIRCTVALPCWPTDVHLAPSGEKLPWQKQDFGRVTITVPKVHIHQMVVFEGIGVDFQRE